MSEKTRISSRATFYYKRIFPAFWFGFLAIFFAAMAFSIYSGNSNCPPAPMLGIPVFMMAFGYVLMKNLIFDLMDEVYNDGNFLFIKNGPQEDRIALSDVINISYTVLMSPPRVTLSLRRKTKFGNEISFCAPVRFVPLAKSPVIEKLITQVDEARRAAP
jgi:hypothetical protein